jgi:hypothetical protein
LSSIIVSSSKEALFMESMQKIKDFIASEKKQMLDFPESQHEIIEKFIQEVPGNIPEKIEKLLGEMASQSYEHAKSSDALCSARGGDFDSQEEQDEAIDNADSEWNYERDELVSVMHLLESEIYEVENPY